MLTLRTFASNSSADGFDFTTPPQKPDPDWTEWWVAQTDFVAPDRPKDDDLSDSMPHDFPAPDVVQPEYDLIFEL